MDFRFIARTRLFTSDAFWFDIDEYRRGGDQMLIAHVRVVHWSPSVRKKLHAVWHAFRTCVTAPIFTFGERGDDKHERFVRSLGFTRSLQTITCENGETRLLFIHTLRT